MNNLLMCLLIIIGKVVAIGIYTLRITLQIRGEKLWVAVLGVLCNLVDVFVLGYVIVFAKTNPMGMICYALGEVGGNLFGMWLDKTFGIGENVITVIVSKDDIDKVNKVLNENDFDGTYSIGSGFKDQRAVYKIPVLRRKERMLKKVLEANDINCVCFENTTVKIDTKKRIFTNYGLKA